MDNNKLLAIDLIYRQKYGLKININNEYDTILKKIDFVNNEWIVNDNISLDKVKPYLIPLNSMTESQQDELSDIVSNDGDITQFCHKHHIDCANLIGKQLALNLFEN